MHTYGTNETWSAHNMSEALLSLIQLQIIIICCCLQSAITIIIIVIADSRISPKHETTNSLLLDGV